MENYTRKNRLKEALDLRGMRQSELCEKTGLPKTSVNGWVKQNWQPKQKALAKMAKVLDVAELWLAGHDVPMERPETQVKMDRLATLIDIIRKDDRLTNLVVNLSSLDDAQLSVIESVVNQLIGVNKERQD